ncbi:protein translocase subunit SecF [bacterium]|nr:MAG: protein translocase subunit SecF [bacterium]
MQFLSNTNIDFMGKRKAAAILSTLVIVAGAVSLAMHGGPNLSIDFRGGQIVEVRCEPAVDLGAARDALVGANVGVQQVQHFGSDEELLIYLDAAADLGVEEGTRTVPQILSEAFPESLVELRREEKVGPKIGKELRTGAINSVIVALALIMLYITVRFAHFQFALGAVVALVHDVLITIGVFSLLDKEISLVILASFLTIIGYSLNDTIVVFDRIRENMSMRRKESYESVVNKSLNQTLSRTIITSITTLLVAVTLFVFGGPVIHDFAFALTIGVLVGTYSSLFVASPVVIAWYRWRSGERLLASKKTGAGARA